MTSIQYASGEMTKFSPSILTPGLQISCTKKSSHCPRKLKGLANTPLPAVRLWSARLIHYFTPNSHNRNSFVRDSAPSKA